MSKSGLLNLDQIKSIQTGLNERVLKRLNKSVVFCDYQFIEWFNLTVGVESLIRQGGALNIKEFSPFQNGEEIVKAVFFVSQPLRDLVIDTLKEILIASKFQFITIVTSVNPASYDESVDFFDQLRDQCLIWMDNANYTCDIFYERFPFAFFSQPKTPAAGGTSSSSSVMSFINPLVSWSFASQTSQFNQIVSVETYQRLVKQEMNDFYSTAGNPAANTAKDHFQQYFSNLSSHELSDLKGLTASLNDMLEHLDAKDDCFSLGILSTLVANELNNFSLSKQRRKTATNKVSLLLIDRSIDVSTVALYQEETAFDKINNLLPNLCSTSNDVQVDLRKFLFDNEHKSILPGTLFHFSSDACRSLIEQYLALKPKECLLDVYRKFCDVYPLSGDVNKKTFRISAESIKTQMKNGLRVNKKAFIENIDLLQIISAYCQIHDASSTKQLEFEKLTTYIKILTQSIFDKDGPSVLGRIYALFSERMHAASSTDSSPSHQASNELNYTISDLFVLLIYVYSLIGEECFYGVEEEERIKKLMIDELESGALSADHRFKSDLDFLTKIQHNQSYPQLIDRFFHNLRRLKFFRKNLKQYNKPIMKDDDKDSFYFKPLVKQVCENLIKTSNNDIPLQDIEYRTVNASNEGFNLFRGFKIGSYLMNSQQQGGGKIHPLNNDLLIIYIIGGISSYECKMVKEAFKDSGKSILVGSSHFLNHEKLIKYILNS